MDDKMTQILNATGIARFQQSYLPKLLLIGFLILLLQIPIAQIRGAIRERQQTRGQAVADVTSKWGSNQSILGPSIVVPYTRRWTERDGEGKEQPRAELAHATFLPENLKIAGDIQSEVRHLGIFEIPVYRMDLNLSGRFARPDLSEWGIAPEDVFWDRAYLSVAIADAKALTKQPSLAWNRENLEFLPSGGEFSPNQQGIHAKLEGRLTDGEFDFSFPLGLKGSVGAYFAPFGRDTEVVLNSNWRAPSFQGAWLPEYQVTEDGGFTSNWNVSFLGRNYPQSWQSHSTNPDSAIQASLFGVDLIYPVDTYRMAERSVKYQILFLVLTFLTLWLFEVLAGIRVHSVQYLLVGAAMCLFYLLELSLAEHLGFEAAYALASLLVIGLITAYTLSVLQSARRAGVVGAMATLLYLYLYTLLMSQDYALLAGSLGLFALLAATMFLTRNVDWYSWGKPEKAKD
jgi:inner membrane protein